MNFNVFKQAVAKQFNAMQKQQLFRANVESDALWITYIDSFPEGTNPKFRERTEHDCSCCRQFIRAVGNAVAIIDGQLVSVWDISIPAEPGYQAVADALSKLVHGGAIGDLFLHFDKTAGTDKNFEQLVDVVKTWDHFFVNVEPKFVKKNADIASALAEPRMTQQVLLRSLNELTIDATETVLELIAQNSLYRGTEHKYVLEIFLKLQKQFAEITMRGIEAQASAKNLFSWNASITVPGSVAKIRNTSIGQLLQDLSEGKDLEQSVKAFEAMVAPANYKRPTSLVTPKMVEQAKEQLNELGLTSALQRRFARLDDITVNNILFADRTARKKLGGDVFDEIATAAASNVKTKSIDKVEEVSIDKFISDILPKAESIEVMVENSHTSNLVSLIAPEDPTAGQLFKWSNNFSWSYNGDMADSIKERVKKAGGNVTGDLCCRLAWDYTDDLDFYMFEPSGHRLYFGNRNSASPCGGRLDVDANGGSGMMKDPVENIFYASRRTMKEGVYTLLVNNYYKRSSGTGFTVEVDYLGGVARFEYAKAVKQSEFVTVAKFKYTHAAGIEMIESLPSTQAVRSTWGVSTQNFHRVNVLLTSPNHWDGQQGIGNKHYFFMLDGCTNEGTARPFFNEFLKENLTPHRKVFEVVGSKLKVKESPDQLSGLGFSSTQKNSVLARVKGSFTRTIKIVF